MWRTARAAWMAALTTAVCGCATGPLQDNPALIRPSTDCVVENPVYVPLGPSSYGMVFEKVYGVLLDYFEISYANRYDGRIETYPRTSPGLERPWQAGSPDFHQRLLATLQTIRNRCLVLIQP